MSKLKQIKSSRGINREEAKEKGILTQYRGTVMDTKKQKLKDRACDKQTVQKSIQDSL